MELLLKCLIDFIGIYIIIFIIYTVFINKKKKNYEKLKKSSDVKVIITRYNLNMRKIKYNNLLRSISLINSFIISFTAVLVMNINSLIWGMVIGLIVIMILTYSLYEIMGRYYQKKGSEEDV